MEELKKLQDELFDSASLYVKTLFFERLLITNEIVPILTAPRFEGKERQDIFHAYCNEPIIDCVFLSLYRSFQNWCLASLVYGYICEAEWVDAKFS